MGEEPLPSVQPDDFPSVIRHVRLFLSLQPREIGALFRETYIEWSKDNAPRLGAALAYYTIFSVAPLLVIVIAAAGLVFGPAAAQGRVVSELQDLVGSQGAAAIEALLKSAWAPKQGLAATFAGLLTLLLGASLVVAELRNALNTVWEVQDSEASPGLLASLLGMLQQRLFAFVLVLGIGFLLLVSLLANAALSAMGSYFHSLLPSPEYVLQAVNFVAWFALTTLIFALIYRVLPDVRIAWSDVIIGAAMTSLLFTTGKLLIALYLGKSSIASAYGAAGSLVVLLAWVYYSAQVFFFGAEFTQVYARKYGSRIVARRRWERKDLYSQRGAA